MMYIVYLECNISDWYSADTLSRVESYWIMYKGWWGWWGSWQWGWSGDQLADRVCWSNDQLADSGVGGLTSQLTVGLEWWLGHQQAMLEQWPVGRQWGWNGDQLADSGDGVMTSWPTVGLEWWPGHWQAMLEQWPVGWQWGWNGDQSANSGVVGLMGWLTVQLECLPFDQWNKAWVIHVTNSMCSADVWHMAHLSCFTIWKFGCPSTMAPITVSWLVITPTGWLVTTPTYPVSRLVTSPTYPVGCPISSPTPLLADPLLALFLCGQPRPLDCC